MELDLTWIGWLHTVVCLYAIVVGAMVLANRKGDRNHKKWGRQYVWSTVLVNVSGLAIYRHGEFGMFHWMAVGTLLCLAVAVAFVRIQRPRGRWMRCHLTAMLSSYLMLFGGGLHQGLARMQSVSNKAIEGSLLFVTLLFLMSLIYFWLTAPERLRGDQ